MSEPTTAAVTAESTKTRVLNTAVSMPTTRAAISEPCNARSARPAGLSMRLPANATAATSRPANT